MAPKTKTAAATVFPAAAAGSVAIVVKSGAINYKYGLNSTGLTVGGVKQAMVDEPPKNLKGLSIERIELYQDDKKTELLDDATPVDGTHATFYMLLKPRSGGKGAASGPVLTIKNAKPTPGAPTSIVKLSLIHI